MNRESEQRFLELKDEQVKKLLSMPQAIALMKDAFCTISSKQAGVPLRSAIDIPQHDARALFMPVYVPQLNMIAVKIVSVYPHNSSVHHIPNIHGKILLIDGSNGVPVCLMDAEHLTALRTGAASGLATDILANREVKVLAIFGTGVQAYTQVQGVLAVRNIQKILVYGMNETAATQFAAKLCADFSVNAITAAREDLKQADIICTATNASKPVFELSDVKPGCHINAIGSFKPNMQELPEQLIVHSRMFVDQREACLAETGDIVIPIQQQLITASHIAGELGEVLNETVAGRTNPDELTVFKSVGNAVQDVYAAHWVFTRSRL